MCGRLLLTTTYSQYSTSTTPTPHCTTTDDGRTPRATTLHISHQKYPVPPHSAAEIACQESQATLLPFPPNTDSEGRDFTCADYSFLLHFASHLTRPRQNLRIIVLCTIFAASGRNEGRSSSNCDTGLSLGYRRLHPAFDSRTRPTIKLPSCHPACEYGELLLSRNRKFPSHL